MATVARKTVQTVFERMLHQLHGTLPLISPAAGLPECSNIQAGPGGGTIRNTRGKNGDGYRFAPFYKNVEQDRIVLL